MQPVIGLRFKSSAIEDVDKRGSPTCPILCASARGACHCSLRGTELAFGIPSARCRRWNAVILEDFYRRGLKSFQEMFEVARQLGNTAQPVIGFGFHLVEIKDVDHDALRLVDNGALFFLCFGFAAVLADFLLTFFFYLRCTPCH